MRETLLARNLLNFLANYFLFTIMSRSCIVLDIEKAFIIICHANEAVLSMITNLLF